MSDPQPRVEGRGDMRGFSHTAAITESGITAPRGAIYESVNSVPPARDETRRTWERDYSAVCEALRPYVRNLPDGVAYVDETIAPAAMVRLYRGLLEVGAARGWMP